MGQVYSTLERVWASWGFASLVAALVAAPLIFFGGKLYRRLTHTDSDTDRIVSAIRANTEAVQELSLKIDNMDRLTVAFEGLSLDRTGPETYKVTGTIRAGRPLMEETANSGRF